MDGTHSVSTKPSQATASPSGRYFRMFGEPDADNGQHSDIALQKLAQQMVLPASEEEDGKDDSEVPAGYTYFAQFAAHDLTFESSTLHQRSLDPRFLFDYRTPRFDLDGLYGRGPDDQPYLYDDKRFLLGPAFLDSNARDVPRTSKRIALIGDPRNDQNAILSQMHGLFLRLHNKLTDSLNGSFQDAQQLVSHHYQYVLLNDLLPRLVGSQLLENYLERTEDGYKLRGLSAYARALVDPAIAIEFSAAVGRLGHSMVRPRYRLNRQLSFSTISSDPFSSLVGFAKPMAATWGIEWDLFVEPPRPPERRLLRDALQMAYKIDACLAEPLTRLPSVLVNLAERNLMRGRALRLPSGQAVARKLGLEPLPDEQIRIGDVSRGNDVPIASIDASLAGDTPLWVYVQAEASAARSADAGKATAPGGQRRQLGEVGGRILAETYIALLAADPTSILNCAFRPSLGIPTKPFDLGALIDAALA